MIDATLVTGIIIVAGLLARLILNVHAENRRLRDARSRTAQLIRRVRRQRDDAREDFVSAIETAVEAQRELDRLQGGQERARAVWN